MFYAGISLLSASTLLFEVALLRLFSISLWHHFAYMVVSIAFLGYGASGTAVMVSKRLKGPWLIKAGPLFFAISVPSAYLVSGLVPFDPVRLAWDYGQLLYIALYYLALSVPFFFSGLTIALAFLHAERKDTGPLYASDLAGAGSGPLAAIVLFPVSGGEGVMLVAAIGGILSSLLITVSIERPKARWFLPHIAGLAALFTLLFLRPHFMEPRISPYKDLPFVLRFEGARILETRWNSFSRVDLVDSPAVRFAPGLSLMYTGTLPRQRGITVDGDNLTAVTEVKEGEDYRFLDYLPTALPYRLLERSGKGRSVFIVDPGGGLPVLESVYHRYNEIHGAEKNPLVVELADRAFNRKVYGEAGITTGEGRAVLRRLNRRFDLITIGISAQNAASSGLHALTEDYRFTVEAFRDYYSHLKEGGLLSITRYLLPPPREELKLVNTAVRALKGGGVEEPAKRIAAYRTIETFTILIKKGDFKAGEIETLKRFLEERRFDAVYHPFMEPEEANRFNRFPEPLYYNLVTKILDDTKREGFIESYPFDLRPPTDARPFFYHFFRLDRIKEVLESVGWKWQMLLEGGYLLPAVFVQAALLSLVVIALPLRFTKTTDGSKAVPSRIKSPVLAYFFLLGVGFMFIEVSLIQRFILFLEHPEYSFSTVVSVLLLSSGAGSLLSRRFDVGKRLGAAVLLLSILSLCYGLMLPLLTGVLLGLGLFIRIILLGLFVVPAGVLMGMPFPMGIRFLKEHKAMSSLVPWAWAVNGCASVLGGILSAMTAMVTGFNGVMAAAGILYITALLVFRPAVRRIEGE